MKTIRKTGHILSGNLVMEGAGVKLRRMAGYYEKEWLDPFLMLDYFGSDREEDYIKGFPWHPHRGIETVTYMLEGSVAHEDSLGNSGVITQGEVQWMTAGSGIIHQEMPVAGNAPMRGFQLWVNLPKAEKMCMPKYRDITAKDIPSILTESYEIKVIAGSYRDVHGPVQDLVMTPFYYDITLNAGAGLQLPVPESYTVLACVFKGDGILGDAEIVNAASPSMISLESGNTVQATAGNKGMRFLLLGGEPLNEPIAWRGPIVMNTDDELRQAFNEYHNNTFLSHQDVRKESQKVGGELSSYKIGKE